jgi:hypothetical protein
MEIPIVASTIQLSVCRLAEEKFLHFDLKVEEHLTFEAIFLSSCKYAIEEDMLSGICNLIFSMH